MSRRGWAIYVPPKFASNVYILLTASYK